MGAILRSHKHACRAVKAAPPFFYGKPQGGGDGLSRQSSPQSASASERLRSSAAREITRSDRPAFWANRWRIALHRGPSVRDGEAGARLRTG